MEAPYPSIFGSVKNPTEKSEEPKPGPLPPSTWPLLRHLTIGLIDLQLPNWAHKHGFFYIYFATRLLESTADTLRTLDLVFDGSEFTTYYDRCAFNSEYNYIFKHVHPEFGSALAAMKVLEKSQFSLRFEFADGYIYMDVKKDMLVTNSIKALVAEVWFANFTGTLNRLEEPNARGYVEEWRRAKEVIGHLDTSPDYQMEHAQKFDGQLHMHVKWHSKEESFEREDLMPILRQLGFKRW